MTLIYLLSFLVIISPVVLALMLTSAWSLRTKVISTVALLFVVLIVPLVVIYFTTGFTLG